MRLFVFVSICTCIVLFLGVTPHLALGETAAEIRAKIEAQQKNIQALEAEIAQYQAELAKTQKEANSLQGAVKELDITSKKIQSDIAYTRNKITNANLTIQKLSGEIQEKETKIDTNRAAIAEAIRALDRAESIPLIVTLLNHDRLSVFWEELSSLQQFQQSVRSDVQVLLGIKRELVASVAERENTKVELEDFKGELEDQHNLVEINKSNKTVLLKETKNKESEYQKIIREKEEQRKLFESQLQDFESQLQFILDPNALPEEGNGVFSWPIVIDPIRITQLFGNTAFAKKNPSVYGSRAYHPGVDFGAPTGTQIRAPLSGTVSYTGNTDAIPGCYSWGKWILIKHNNGISTLYAHLSIVKVATGDKVSTGDLIGYSGSTGYSTGPHLHFAMYASEGVQIVPFESIRATTNCKGGVTPAAAANAYLDPMSYLPQDGYILDTD